MSDDLELDLELEVEIDVEELSGEIDEGFVPYEIPNLRYIEEDIIGLDEIVIDLNSEVETMNIAGPSSSDTLMLDIGEVEIDLGTPDTAQKYEVAITPAQNAVAIYTPPEDESFRVELRNKEIHDTLHNVRRHGEEAQERLRALLEEPKYNLIPKHVKFMSKEFKGQSDFRTMLITSFLNHLSVPETFTADHVVEKMFKAYEAEELPKMTSSKAEALEKLIREFITFGVSVYSEAKRRTELVEYKEEHKELVPPEMIGNFVYVCKCGNEYPMPSGRPTMTFLIRAVNKTPLVVLINPSIRCDTCNHWLSIPTPLVEAIEVNMQNFVNKIKATYEQPRIYRPAISELKNIIPANISNWFSFDTAPSIEIIAEKDQAHNNVASGYKKLIKMWMTSVESEKTLAMVKQNFIGDTKASTIVDQLSLVNFGVDVELYSYQVVKTMIHYLQGFSSFAITHDKKVYYDYCNKLGYETKAFPITYGVEWIYDNAPYLAGLENIYNADTTMEPLGILPEYVDALNYVLSLHLLSNGDLFIQGSDLAKWVKNPTASRKKLEGIYKKEPPLPKNQMVTSHRLLLPSKEIYPIETWSDAYSFFKTIAYPLRMQPGVSAELRTLITKAGRTATAEEFYGVESLSKLTVRPSFMFDEFMEAFKLFGYKLFKGLIMNEVRKNLAIGVETFLKAERLDEVFVSSPKPITNVADILMKKEVDAVNENRLLLELVIKVGDLPEDLSTLRDDIGYKDILTNLSEHKDILLADKTFASLWGELVECY